MILWPKKTVTCFEHGKKCTVVPVTTTFGNTDTAYFPTNSKKIYLRSNRSSFPASVRYNFNMMKLFVLVDYFGHTVEEN
jgi:hypothetical protein